MLSELWGPDRNTLLGWAAVVVVVVVVVEAVVYSEFACSRVHEAHPGGPCSPQRQGQDCSSKVHGILLCLPLELAFCKKNNKDQTFMGLKTEMWTLDV